MAACGLATTALANSLSHSGFGSVSLLSSTMSAARGGRAGVAGTGKAQVAPVDDQPHVGEVALDHRHRIVAAGVVDDDDLHVAEALSAQRAEHDRQQARAVVVGHHDRGKGRCHFLQRREGTRRPRVEIVRRGAKAVDVERNRVAHDHAVVFAQLAVGVVQHDGVAILAAALGLGQAGLGLLDLLLALVRRFALRRFARIRFWFQFFCHANST